MKAIQPTAMARAPHSPSNSSQKENIPALTEKHSAMAKSGTHTSNAKRRGSQPTRKQRVAIDLLDDSELEDEDSEDSEPNPEAVESGVEDSDEEHEDEQCSPKGTKRIRMSEAGETIERNGKITTRPVTLARDADGYVPGSIVRMKLHQFLTYDDVEFRPGPHLNMVIGPNGTGKSSIACALCLGLNWPPHVLGRATEINRFVKQGSPDGTGFIEIELKGPIGEDNIIIQRHFTESTKNSKFFLNGKSAPAKQVSAKVQSLNIQCGNLCSFLPQDKVAEFARLTPQELLKATQAAAGHEKLSTWHGALIEDGNRLRELVSSIDGDNKHLETLVQRNAQLERDVQRYKERRQIEQNIEILEVLIQYKEFMESKKTYHAAKKRRDKLNEKYLDMEKRNKPIQRLRNRLQRQESEASDERNEQKKAAARRFKEMKLKWEENDRLETEADEIVKRLTSLKEDEKQRKERIKKYTKITHDLEHKVAHPPEVEDIEDVNSELRKSADDIHRLKAEKEDFERKVKAQIDESSKQTAIIERNTNEIKKLQDLAERKLTELQNDDPDCADAVRWLRKNQHRFRMQVFEPPILSVNMQDHRYAHAVEACFSYNQLRTFVCQCKEDYSLMHQLFADTTEALGRKAVINTWYRPKNEPAAPPPMNQVELEELGFEKYALDCILCPDGILDFLKRELQLHRTAVALRRDAVDIERAMDVVSQQTPDGKGGQGNFIVGRVMNVVRRSYYGQRLPQNSTREIRNAKYFASLPVDEERKRKLEAENAECRQKQAMIEEEVRKLEGRLRQFEGQLNELYKAKEEIETRKRKIHDAQKELVANELALAQYTDKLAREQNAPSLEEERQKLRQSSFNIAKKRIAIIKEVQRIVRAVTEDHTEATRAGLRYIQAGANKTALQELCNTRTSQTDEIKQQYEEACQVFEQAKVKTGDLLRLSKQKAECISEDEVRQELQRRTDSQEFERAQVNELRETLEDERAKLEVSYSTSSNVIEQYEKRQKDIERLSEEIQDKSVKRQLIERKVERIKSKWVPKLEELIAAIGEKFSDAFDRVGCAGEIRLSQHEDDYDKWAIDILVKFRDNEKLQLLTGQRQSGGERALTTIMYLMSLTELARTPFSLVDEINQGMDARYERAVHNSLVEVTCREDSGQYFLITPKLLTDLQYHERMKLLCINNGEWLPEENEDRNGSLMGMIDRYVAASA